MQTDFNFRNQQRLNSGKDYLPTKEAIIYIANGHIATESRMAKQVRIIQITYLVF